MSFLEVRDRGLPYGGIPYEELLNKLEETDMNETTEDIENNYNNYIRSEIVDWNQDVPFLESDKTRRDPSISKSVINLRYNGARGEYEHPVHPEMFVGFMDQDNRALDNNPRMDQYQEQIATRMPNLEIRMGHNCVDNDHESPWTNQSIGQCRRDIQTSLAYNTKVFTDERDGRALNRNFVTDYDHNKKALIYKDVLPSGINGITENERGKSSTSYTTSSVPFVSTDTNFTPSYKNINNYCAGLMPGMVNKCSRNVGHDQATHEEFVSANSAAFALRQESKMKTVGNDQVHTEHYDNNPNRNSLPGSKYTAGNVSADMRISDVENVEYKPVKTNIVNPITNPKLIDNDPTFYESNRVDVRRLDSMKQSNANNFIMAELHPHDITNSETELQKNVSLYGNNNNITLINSSYYIPEFQFRHMEIAKHAQFPDNQTVINKTNYEAAYGHQEETQMRTNKYRFSDDVGKTMRYSSSTVPDTTSETLLRSIGGARQEHKMKTTNPENVWAVSDMNIAGKTQKQSRTGGIEPIVMEVPDTHDFVSGNGGSIIGKKSIRGDKVSSDHLSSMSENLTFDDF